MEQKRGFLDLLFRSEKLHNTVVKNICQHPHVFLYELRMNGKLLFLKEEPEAFERGGKRVDVIFIVQRRDFRRDHRVTIYEIILIEVKVGRWQNRTGVKQLRECRDFLIRKENWKTWLEEKVAKLEGREVRLHLVLLRAKKTGSWKDMVCDLSRHNLPGKTKLGRCSAPTRVSIAEYLEAKGQE